MLSWSPWSSLGRPSRARSRDTADLSSSNGENKIERSPSTLQPAIATVLNHIKHHVGVGIVCAVAYFDPGNWSTDLLAGSQFGYKLLFIVLLSGLGAVILQVLSCKLGCVTGLDLASHCRLLMNNHPRYPKLVRYVFLYPLYILSELAIISTDIAELLGSAIGLVLVIPQLPLPIAVLLTAVDVIFIIALGDVSHGHGKAARIFEFIIIVLVLVVFACFVALIVKVHPYWPDVFNGYLPSKALVEPSALYAAVGIIGATVMPHGMYLGSHLSTLDRVSSKNTSSNFTLPQPSQTNSTTGLKWLKKALKDLISVRRVRQGREEDQLDTWTPYGERKNNPLSFVKAHYKHGLWDLVLSLLGFAVTINSAILVLSGSVFFFGPGKTANSQPAGLFDAHDLIRDFIGKPAAVVFAIALICSGQSASVTATLAGQIVSEGFIQWRISPFLRRLLTRLLGLIPAMVVAIIFGRAGIDTLLVISQVVLSIVLPFVMFPLIWLTSSSVVMRVQRPRSLDKGASIDLDEVDFDQNGPWEKQDRSSKEASSDNTCKELPGLRMEGEIIEVLAQGSVESFSQDLPEERDAERKGKEPEVKTVYVENAATPLSVGDEGEFIDYSNGWPLTLVSYAIWIVIIAANGYLIVTLVIS